MKIKILLFALCALHQTYTAQPPSLEDATNLLASMCRFTRGVDYVANPEQQDPKLTPHVATQALAFLYNNKKKPVNPTDTLLKACKTCNFTSPGGQVLETIWQAAQQLEKFPGGHDYMPDFYNIDTKQRTS